MGVMASQITGASIICWTICSGADQKKHQSAVSMAFVREFRAVTGEFSSQRASNAENVFIW